MLERFSRASPIVRLAAPVLAVWMALAATAAGQTPPLVFTAAPPARDSSSADVHAAPVVAERGLAMWEGAADFGLGVDMQSARWTVRSVASLYAIPLGGHPRPTFQQVELLRPVLTRSSASVAAGGGIREEWDGTRVLLGRALAGVEMAGGRLQGSFVMERALSSRVRRDAADLVTSVGWSRRVGARVAVGVEGIGQDLEGFWDASEADGGARLLVGPSLQVRSRRGDWSASATLGPVFKSTTTPSSALTRMQTGGRNYGIFASASWLPVRR